MQGKPRNREHAQEMLRMLSGREHIVETAVAFVKNDGSIETRSDQTIVTFKELTDGEIDFYVDNYQPFDKAGS